MMSVHMNKKVQRDVYRGDEFVFYIFLESQETTNGIFSVNSASAITVILQGTPNQQLTLADGDAVYAGAETAAYNSIKCTVSEAKSTLLKEGISTVVCICEIAGVKTSFEAKATFTVVAPTITV